MTSPTSAPGPRREVERYRYERDGQWLSFVVRFAHADGSKSFLQGRPSGVPSAGTGKLPAGGTVWSLNAGYFVRKTNAYSRTGAAPEWITAEEGAPGAVYCERCPRVPYNLSEVRKATMVYAVEGEKDEKTLGAMGLCATTNQGGSGGKDLWAQPEFRDEFRGKVVVHLGDNDREGREHVIARLRALDGVVAEQGFVELPGLPHGGDITDWVASGHTRQELDELVRAAPPLDRTGIDALAESWGISEREPRREHRAPPPPPDGEPPRRDNAASGEPWPKPDPLPDELPPVARFDPDLLPEPFRPLGDGGS